MNNLLTHYPVNWIDGMKLSSSHFIAVQDFVTDGIRNAIALQTTDLNYGLQPAGHIQMYNGEKWVSDFVQRRFWPGTAYENDYKKRKEEKREVNFKIFRW